MERFFTNLDARKNILPCPQCKTGLVIQSQKIQLGNSLPLTEADLKKEEEYKVKLPKVVEKYEKNYREWVSREEDKKEIEYAPIFYSADSFCEKSTLEDSNGTYTLGTVIWNDNTRLENKYLMTKPIGQIPYTISSTYLAFTNAPIDKETLESMVQYYNETKDMLKLYQKINDHCAKRRPGRCQGIGDRMVESRIQLLSKSDQNAHNGDRFWAMDDQRQGR